MKVSSEGASKGLTSGAVSILHTYIHTQLCIHDYWGQCIDFLFCLRNLEVNKYKGKPHSVLLKDVSKTKCIGLLNGNLLFVCKTKSIGHGCLMCEKNLTHCSCVWTTLSTIVNMYNFIPSRFYKLLYEFTWINCSHYINKTS